MHLNSNIMWLLFTWNTLLRYIAFSCTGERLNVVNSLGFWIWFSFNRHIEHIPLDLRNKEFNAWTDQYWNLNRLSWGWEPSVYRLHWLILSFLLLQRNSKNWFMAVASTSSFQYLSSQANPISIDEPFRIECKLLKYISARWSFN